MYIYIYIDRMSDINPDAISMLEYESLQNWVRKLG